ncbi:LSU ribosomal protein L25P [Sulfurimonas denitrificans DSM 1251]|uniref:Large ribosomal subunit protein bL25 n=1 Tax=Sulfurimonas denitrificans (strain ATCC 33889 / DSM 1251) TaxID=326298 RepID=RL25_SULDN|nr:50S ribosomal protein L25/general stress protein Ctc [Sulfurimonas denitrificans]Q30TD5.1 RecName: Full=Large ribosomal subunit protein bL25; AltName: Full=50S ribosomal protein L25; AltName: Full=General stress protein CTC [Sulfurimonas denitrificans DSM 1251]ABB43746.1 LSU ribosomal protein L25P [Sulfurimonas denitrificans DSM 1251]MDD3442414.1 50S ribosomal protein L25/general stress protein Ctc [Sulfurimonas denitrificans]
MLEGIIRESIGKKGTKALRRDGYLIANIYGKGLQNLHAAFKENEYIRTVRNKETLSFPIKVDSKEMNVVVQAYEAHPVTGKLLHVDLMVAQPNVVTHYHVPVVTEGDAIGLKNKGLIHISKPRLRVKATIENTPNSIVVDVTKMDVGDAKMVRDIAKIANVTFTDADRVSVLSVIKAK